MSGEADGFSGSDVPVLFELMYEALHFLAFPGQRFPGAERLRQPVGRAGVSRASSSLQVRSFPCRGPAAGRRLPRRSRPSDAVAFPSRRLAGRSRCSRRPHRASSAGYRHPSPGNSCIRRKPATPEHRAPGSIASGEALREPGMSFRIFASRIVICPLLGIVAGRSPACRFEQQCQLFFIDGTGVV